MKFFVAGVPVPQGSKTHVGGGVMLDGSTPKARAAFGAWREHVGWAARIARENEPAWRLDEPAYTIALRFFFVPAKSRGAGFTGYAIHNQTPDLDKLIRHIFDSITGVLVVDDRRIAHMGEAGKWWHPTRAGVEIEILPHRGMLLPERRRRAHKATSPA